MKESSNRPQLHISVRNLVEFIFREGDIDNRTGKLNTADAMLAGSRIHRKIQQSQVGDYMAEVSLKMEIEEPMYDLTVEGRADGVWHGPYDETKDGISEYIEDLIYIDEIKGIYRSLDYVEEPLYVHLAQAMCYAYMYGVKEEVSHIGVRIIYCNLDTEEKKTFCYKYSFEELRSWFFKLIGEYRKWAEFEIQWKKIRKASIADLEFPFDYREGQKKLVTDVYRTIQRKKNLFIQAPTGVGKTISTIFPGVKAVGEDLVDRIFYLTAKTITATVAQETFQLLANRGYKGKVIHLTAKEKMCLCEEMECNPVHCPYAKGHFDRVNDAVYEILEQQDAFTREEILEQSKKHMVCPFELSLDISSWCDVIICDYNYAFDPNVYLKRFFQEGEKGDYLFLVDEAHNLVERARSMYSETLYKEDFLLAKRIMSHYSKSIEKALEKCNRILLEYKRECVTYILHENIGNLIFALMRLSTLLEDFFSEKQFEFAGKKDVLDLYFKVRNFLNISSLVDENYEIFSENGEDGRFMIKLFCVNPAKNLQQCLDKAKSTIFFSATLLPIQYYKELLSTKEDNYAIYAQSTFEASQRLLLMGRDVSTKYTRRTKDEFEKIAHYIRETIACKKGNYMIFFPSYKLMQQVQEVFLNLDQGKTECIVQESGMKEEEKEAFLNSFAMEREKSLAAFCVMGGIFSEGIDLVNDKLIGAIVVGTGLPQVSNEREILKNHYDETNGNGFDYAFRFPGMNKVLQAAGRVIRTNEDRGIILLLDERFLQSDYQWLYPREWEDRKSCNLSQVTAYVSEFWDSLDSRKNI